MKKYLQIAFFILVYGFVFSSCNQEGLGGFGFQEGIDGYSSKEFSDYYMSQAEMIGKWEIFHTRSFWQYEKYKPETVEEDSTITPVDITKAKLVIHSPRESIEIEYTYEPATVTRYENGKNVFTPPFVKFNTNTIKVYKVDKSADRMLWVRYNSAFPQLQYMHQELRRVK